MRGSCIHDIQPDLQVHEELFSGPYFSAAPDTVEFAGNVSAADRPGPERERELTHPGVDYLPDRKEGLGEPH